MTRKDEWILSLTPQGQSGREIGRYSSRDEAMLEGTAHYLEQMKLPRDSDEELGWQMSFNGATALSAIGSYRVRRS